jgi:hypothetical protein
MYHFGPEFRPVPLDQTFVGITEKQKVRRNDIMNQNACEKMVTALERGKQVMIFVHSRKEASRSAEAMRDLTAKMGTSNLLENCSHDLFGAWKRAVEKCRSIEVQQLFFKVRTLVTSLSHFILPPPPCSPTASPTSHNSTPLQPVQLPRPLYPTHRTPFLFDHLCSLHL